MPTAVAAIPLPGLPTAIAASTGSGADAAGVDFAALLLGQLAGDIAKQILPASAIDGTDATLPAEAGSDTAGTDMAGAGDPTLLLAAMGLVLDPRAPQAGGAPSTNGGSPPPLAAANLTQSTAAAELSAATPATPTAAAAAPTGDDGKPAPFAATAAAQAPANFAAVEQKLAESTAAIAEAPTHAVPTPATPHAPTRTGADALQLATPVRDPAWPGEFSQKIVWMATQDRQNAQITLNPPQMGPIEISLSVKNDQASAVFVSANAEVREVIEAALPRLREMLAGVGVELGQANVSAESFRQAQQQFAGERGTAGTSGGHDEGHSGRMDAGSGATRAALRAGNGLVDTFA